MAEEPLIPGWMGIFMLPLCGYLVWGIVTALRTGVARVKNGDIPRSQHVVLFWLALAMQAFMLVVFSIIALGMLTGRL